MKFNMLEITKFKLILIITSDTSKENTIKNAGPGRFGDVEGFFVYSHSSFWLVILLG